MTARVQVNVSLTPEQHEELSRIAAAMKLGPHGVTFLIRLAVGLYLGNPPSQE